MKRRFRPLVLGLAAILAGATGAVWPPTPAEQPAVPPGGPGMAA